MRGAGRGAQRRFHLTAFDELLQLGAGLLVVRYHLLCKGLDGLVAARKGELTVKNFFIFFS